MIGTFQVSTTVETCTGHRLEDYDGKCAHPHGHNYKWEVVIFVPSLQSNGIAVDFGELKAAVNEILEPFDHAMVLRHDDTLIPFLKREKNRLVVFPQNPTAEWFARYLCDKIVDKFGYTARVTVHETSKHFIQVEDYQVFSQWENVEVINVPSR